MKPNFKPSALFLIWFPLDSVNYIETGVYTLHHHFPTTFNLKSPKIWLLSQHSSNTASVKIMNDLVAET